MSVDINLSSLMQLMLQQQAQTAGPSIDYSKPYTGMAPAGKYPAPVGKRYRGEFPGWSYDPFYDKYFPNQQTKTGYENSSNETAKGPSTAEQIGLMLLGGGVNSLVPTLFGGGSTGKTGQGAGTPGGLVGQGLSSLYHSIFGSTSDTPTPSFPGLASTPAANDAFNSAAMNAGANGLTDIGSQVVGDSATSSLGDLGASSAGDIADLLA